MGFDFQGHNTFAAPKKRKDSVIHPAMHVHVHVLLEIFHVGCGIIHTPRGVFESCIDRVWSTNPPLDTKGNPMGFHKPFLGENMLRGWLVDSPWIHENSNVSFYNMPANFQYSMKKNDCVARRSFPFGMGLRCYVEFWGAINDNYKNQSIILLALQWEDFHTSGQILIFHQPRFPWNSWYPWLNHHLGWGRVRSL